MNFNAGVILTDEEVRELTEAGCEIYPTMRVDTDKNAYLRSDNDYGSCKEKGSTRCGNFETTKDVAQILPHYPRSTDTSAMLSGCFTKTMTSPCPFD